MHDVSNVYILFDYWNNCLSYESEMDGDDIIGVYSTYDKAKQAAMNWIPDRCATVFDENDKPLEKVITEMPDVVHIRNCVVRDVKEYVSEYHQYEHELYILKREVE